ncbi:MAG: bifunctional 4-hydroxy-2-oxoglutarate aldolase/2-dehydro-3-deoxy-phosphogluconate aldolase [Clostridia bacterium]|nr:bifunctional 4-hydroxy-2-oxoglutarate aldolase/2-dehydro-3-deoxy-phosphogluconate aldolase [Clostridia bacterium]
MDNVLDRIAQCKIVPVVKIDDVQDTLPLMKALKDGGIMSAEITFRTAVGPDALALAAKSCPDMLIGAGTVINAEQATKAVSLGAAFVVGPGFSKEVADVCREAGVLYLPGVVTPTEVMMAVAEGLKVVKFFPAENYGGVKTIKALAGPFPQLKFMPTGGISAENIKGYFDSGKVIACGGSWMVKDSLIKAKEFDKITALSKEAMEVVK